ncbi:MULTISPECIES: LysR family transcriptional regulator [unclassified Undibacterium]|uniref:LysR family transcriptional regulator n=1 Tax=unclassified Undibacterium TaxID=2630295 RepID=UPI002AC89E05|nr:MULTISPECIES: LysR substrate-binding domain-containing protein [unclassified Undibacterium]MEB0138804.1 LysR substrate-binding domain-containing protein [Undibacterium sp. CCC2.1]MEB0170720.1 LysR substrate-binding domain-containing protein [Undibacterium sp. CCC1.1]MEB0174609.1 LysR substrate-binding domain-containing protein [Undibacterium sp. CCC3.4]MEB0213806.1 LysR substrate-binding domain-containing protein [Undibacterium sp. 5I2]WPX42534.1 LysR substrate-binding domain-containing pro
MDLHSLTLLVEIIDAGNLSQAAKKLKMTRANVSYHLAQLERAVGAQLVRRTTRRVEPTEIGQRLYQHGLGIQNELFAARETIQSLGQSLQGRVRLSVPSGYGQMVMAPWLIEFKRAYPAIVLQVLFENRVDDLMRDEIDIAVRVMSQPPQTLVARQLGTVRYIACATSTYAERHGMPRTLAALAGVALISSAVIGQQLRLSAYRAEQREEVMLEPTLISEHFPFLRQAILAGLGVGVVPDYVVAEEVHSGAVVTTLDDYRLSIFGSELFMLYMPNRYQTKAAHTFIDFMLERARESGASAAT